MSERRKALIVSDFKDAGTGERFAAGATPMLTHGAYANYEAAGLVTSPPPAKAAPARRAPPRKAKPAVSKTPVTAPVSVDKSPAAAAD